MLVFGNDVHLQVKCAPYWPTGESSGTGSNMFFEKAGLSVTLSKEENSECFIKRNLIVEELVVHCLVFESLDISPMLYVAFIVCDIFCM